MTASTGTSTATTTINATVTAGAWIEVDPSEPDLKNEKSMTDKSSVSSMVNTIR